MNSIRQRLTQAAIWSVRQPVFSLATIGPSCVLERRERRHGVAAVREHRDRATDHLHGGAKFRERRAVPGGQIGRRRGAGGAPSARGRAPRLRDGGTASAAAADDGCGIRLSALGRVLARHGLRSARRARAESDVLAAARERRQQNGDEQRPPHRSGTRRRRSSSSTVRCGSVWWIVAIPSAVGGRQIERQIVDVHAQLRRDADPLGAERVHRFCRLAHPLLAGDHDSVEQLGELLAVVASRPPGVRDQPGPDPGVAGARARRRPSPARAPSRRTADRSGPEREPRASARARARTRPRRSARSRARSAARAPSCRPEALHQRFGGEALGGAERAERVEQARRREPRRSRRAGRSRSWSS